MKDHLHSELKNKLSEGLANPIANYFSFRAIMVPVMFIIIAMIYLFAPEYAIFMPMLVPIVMIIIRKLYEKSFQKNYRQKQPLQLKRLNKSA